MFKVATFLLILFFSNNVFAEDDISKINLNTVVRSVVSVYSISSSNKEEIDNFLKSSNNFGEKGSGVIIGEDGLIITNNHVIDGKNVIKVVLQDGRSFQAKVLARDSSLDLSMLELISNTSKLNTIKISNSDSLEIGDKVYAIGNPFGVGVSVTSGIISALPSKNNSFSGLGNLIQTDASMNPGNSGGALVNINGELIGINTGIFGDVFLGIGFAIPSNVVQLFINRSIEGQKVRKYWLGFAGVNVTNEMINRLGLSSPKGVIVTDVFMSQTDEKNKIAIGDVVLKVGDKEVDSTSTLSFIVASIDNDHPVPLLILRAGEEQLVYVKPEQPKDNIPSDITKIEEGLFKGAIIANNSYAVSYEILSNPADKGVVIYNIDRKSILYSLGVKRGDILVSINDKRIITVASLLEILEEIKDDNDYFLLIRRNGNEVLISATYSPTE